MKSRKKPQQAAIEQAPDAGTADGGHLDRATLDAMAKKVHLDPATLDEIARVAGVPAAKLGSFKEELLLVLDGAKIKPSRTPAKRREVISLLDGLIKALEPFLDEKSFSAVVARGHIAGFVPTSFESLVQHVTSPARLEEDIFRTERIFKDLIEKVRRAKESAKLSRGRGAPSGTRQGKGLDAVLGFLVGRAEDWGVTWTAYKDHSDGAAKGTLVDALRLLPLVLPRSDRTLLKAIDRARKERIGHIRRKDLYTARTIWESRKGRQNTHPK